jgi:hypothetical protein
MVSYQYNGRRRAAVACAEGKSILSLGWFPEGEITVRLIAPDESYFEVMADVAAGRAKELVIDASPEARARDWRTNEPVRTLGR